MNKKLITIPCLFFIMLFIACSGPKEEKSSVETSKIVEEPVESQVTAPKEVAETKNSEEAVKEEEKPEPEPLEEEDVEEVEPLSIEQIQKADEIIAEVTMANVDAVDSKKLFRMHCAICHGFKGNMMVNGAKDLTKSKIPLNESVAQIYHGKGLMTPYNGILSDAEIVAMAKYTEKLRKK